MNIKYAWNLVKKMIPEKAIKDQIMHSARPALYQWLQGIADRESVELEQISVKLEPFSGGTNGCVDVQIVVVIGEKVTYTSFEEGLEKHIKPMNITEMINKAFDND